MAETKEEQHAPRMMRTMTCTTIGSSSKIDLRSIVVIKIAGIKWAYSSRSSLSFRLQHIWPDGPLALFRNPGEVGVEVNLAIKVVAEKVVGHNH